MHFNLVITRMSDEEKLSRCTPSFSHPSLPEGSDEGRRYRPPSADKV
ncbi:MAG: hypothetical protein OCD76_25475 [Reichenbachiella sp.]